MGYDVPAVYANVSSEIPEEFAVAMKDDQYYIYTDHTGKSGFVGKSWIKPEGLVEITDAETTLVVKGSDVAAIKVALSYANVTIKSIDVTYS